MSKSVLVIYISTLAWVSVTALSAYMEIPALLRYIGLAAAAVFILATVFSTVRFMKQRTPGDLWKIQFLGLLGLLGLLPEVNNGIFGLFGLFGFIAYRNRGQ